MRLWRLSLMRRRERKRSWLGNSFLRRRTPQLASFSSGSMCRLRARAKEVSGFGCTAVKLNVPSGSNYAKGIVVMPEGATNSRDKLQKIVADALQLPVDAVPADAKSETIEAWDSLRHL